MKRLLTLSLSSSQYEDGLVIKPNSNECKGFKFHCITDIVARIQSPTQYADNQLCNPCMFVKRLKVVSQHSAVH